MHNSLFEIHADWLPKQDALPPDARLARISIVLDGVYLTHNVNIFDHTHSDFLIAAPYPMALWFLDNWWRLCFEPTPDMPTRNWRISHVLSSAGYGYSWPTIVFQTDSQHITVTSIPTFGADVGSAHFTNACTSSMPLTTFATAICTFVKDCMLHAADADLEAIYAAVQEEQNDKEIVLYRTIEAMLGFDAGCGREDKLTRLLRIAQTYGAQTVCERSRVLYNCHNPEEDMQAVRNGQTDCKVDISSLPNLPEAIHLLGGG